MRAYRRWEATGELLPARKARVGICYYQLVVIQELIAPAYQGSAARTANALAPTATEG